MAIANVTSREADSRLTKDAGQLRPRAAAVRAGAGGAFPDELNLGWLDGIECYLDRFIATSDKVLADFSVNSIDGDGLYLLNSADGLRWAGCRQFEIRDGEIYAYDIDKWVAFDPRASRYRVIGKVLSVHKRHR